MSDVDLRERLCRVGELRLHLVEAGPENGPLVLLLHGFPAFWWSWRSQIGPLARAGFRVVAPDLRGYNESDRPRGVAAYRMAHLVADVDGLIDAFGRTAAHVVGHDWGGAIAWSFAERRPERVLSLAALNCPHPKALVRALRRPGQLRRSWYIFAFQIPWLPERALMARDAALLRRVLGPCRADESERYIEAARRGGGLRAPIHYYRAAALDALGGGPESRAITGRTLVLWGAQDPVFERSLARPDPADVPHARVEFVEAAGHDVHVDAAAFVNGRLLEHFAPAAT